MAGAGGCAARRRPQRLAPSSTSFRLSVRAPAIRALDRSAAGDGSRRERRSRHVRIRPHRHLRRITADIVSAIEMAPETGVCPGITDGSSIAQRRTSLPTRGIAASTSWRSGPPLAAPAIRAASGAHISNGRSRLSGSQGEKATTVVFWKELRKGALGETQSDDDEREAGRAFSPVAIASSTQTKSTAMNRTMCRICPRPSASREPRPSRRAEHSDRYRRRPSLLSP